MRKEPAGGGRFRVLVLVLLGVTLLLALPVINVLVATTVAQTFGCRLDEASTYPCPVLGVDVGPLIGVMGVTGWFMLVTVPLLALVAPVWAGVAIYAVLRWWRRRQARA